MHFVDGIRPVQPVLFFTGNHPVLVLPIVGIIPNQGRCLRRLLAKARKRIRLFGPDVVVVGMYLVLVLASLVHSWNKSFPNTAAVPSNIQLMFPGSPIIKITDNAYRFCTRGPNSKISALYTIDLGKVRPQFIVKPKMFPSFKKVDIKISKKL